MNTKTRDSFIDWLGGIFCALLGFATLGVLVVLAHTLLFD